MRSDLAPAILLAWRQQHWPSNCVTANGIGDGGRQFRPITFTMNPTRA